MENNFIEIYLEKLGNLKYADGTHWFCFNIRPVDEELWTESNGWDLISFWPVQICMN